MSYQDRKDIDNLYNLVWDATDNQLKLISKSEFNELKDEVYTNYYPISEVDRLFVKKSSFNLDGIGVSDSLGDVMDTLEVDTVDELVLWIIDQLTN